MTIYKRVELTRDDVLEPSDKTIEELIIESLKLAKERDMDNATELKPCPFCGGEAVLCKDYEPDEQWSHKVALVKCQSCGCNTGSYIIDGYYGAKTTVQSAIKAWNKRI